MGSLTNLTPRNKPWGEEIHSKPAPVGKSPGRKARCYQVGFSFISTNDKYWFIQLYFWFFNQPRQVTKLYTADDVTCWVTPEILKWSLSLHNNTIRPKLRVSTLLSSMRVWAYVCNLNFQFYNNFKSHLAYCRGNFGFPIKMCGDSKSCGVPWRKLYFLFSYHIHKLSRYKSIGHIGASVWFLISLYWFSGYLLNLSISTRFQSRSSTWGNSSITWRTVNGIKDKYDMKKLTSWSSISISICTKFD